MDATTQREDMDPSMLNALVMDDKRGNSDKVSVMADFLMDYDYTADEAMRHKPGFVQEGGSDMRLNYNIY